MKLPPDVTKTVCVANFAFIQVQTEASPALAQSSNMPTVLLTRHKHTGTSYSSSVQYTDLLITLLSSRLGMPRLTLLLLILVLEKAMMPSSSCRLPRILVGPIQLYKQYSTAVDLVQTQAWQLNFGQGPRLYCYRPQAQAYLVKS